MSADRLTLEHAAGAPWKGEAETSGLDARTLVIEHDTLFEAMRAAAAFFGEADHEPDELEDEAPADDADNEVIHGLTAQLSDANGKVSDLTAKLSTAEDKIAELTAKIVELNKPADPPVAPDHPFGGQSTPPAEADSQQQLPDGFQAQADAASQTVQQPVMPAAAIDESGAQAQ